MNIVPVAISYEWESCDILKALELYASQRTKYIKKPGEDLNSILTGIMQPKGKVHIEFCDLLTKEELMKYDDLTQSDFNRQIAALIDERICRAYRLTPNNYIAHDIRFGNQEYRDQYTDEQKEAFINRLIKLQAYADSCESDMYDIFLGIYSNPVDSKNKYAKQTL